MRFRSAGALSLALMLSSLLAACGGGGSQQSAVLPNSTGPSSAGEKNLATVTSGQLHRLPDSMRPQHGRSHSFLAPGARPNVRPQVSGSYYDLNYHGGAVMSSATVYNVYINGNPSYYGAPGTFWTNVYYNNSFVHILDQYVSTSASYRYPYGGYVNYSYSAPNGFSQGDIDNILYDVAINMGYGTGYNRMYNLFFPPNSGVVGANTCGYHTYDDFGSSHVIYSVDAYGGGPCYSEYGSVTNAAAALESHEDFEAFSDPDINAWYNNNTGMEIGDNCEDGGSDFGSINLNGTSYYIQKEWSNRYAGCRFSP